MLVDFFRGRHDAEFLDDQLVPFPSPPEFYLSSYLGFRPIFHFPYLAHDSKKQPIFKGMVPILKSHFFNFLSDFFCFGPFSENFEHLSCTHSPQNCMWLE